VVNILSMCARNMYVFFVYLCIYFNISAIIFLNHYKLVTAVDAELLFLCS